MQKQNTITAIFSVLSVTLYPCFYLYFRNLGTASLSDFLSITVIFALAGVFLFILGIVIFRSSSKAGVMASLIALILLYFALIEKGIVKILPMVYYWHVALVCLFVIAHLVFLIKQRLSTKPAEKINQGLLVIFAGLILFNGIPTIPKWISIASQQGRSNDREEAHALADVSASDNTGNLPNVYYFIFDEYGGYDSIQRYCNYDNSDFYFDLEEMGFVTAKHAVNKTIDSYTEVPNLLQLQQVNSVEMTANDKKENLKNPYLLAFMKELGYTINALDSTGYQFIDKEYADTLFTETYISTYGTFHSYIIQNTAFYPFYGSSDHKYEIDRIVSMFGYATESSKMAKSNQFTVGYFSFPHVPYIVDENGYKTNDADRLNLRDSAVYLSQFKFASKKIIEMVNEIIVNDPNAVIILQSDHGFRLPSHLKHWYHLDTYNLEEEFQYERNILNAVYFQDKPIEIEGLTGLDTLKVVLNKLFDADIELTN